MPTIWVQVALDVPLPGLFDYRLPAGEDAQIGERVLVKFGSRERIGLIIRKPAVPDFNPESVQEVLAVLHDLPPLPADWIEFAEFAGQYYQRPLGEVVMPAMPAMLRRPSAYRAKGGGPVERLNRGRRRRAAEAAADPQEAASAPALNAEQQQAVKALLDQKGFQTFLLHGVTGSGKTEVYLRAAQAVLDRGRNVLILVPEINLTPQFLRHLRQRFSGQLLAEEICVFHSGLSEGERLRSWVNVQRGAARIILGTRLAVLSPAQQLGLIVVDEEHDPSYKQKDGLRYSARDLAVWRGRQLDIPVVLGSATPSLETWHHVQQRRYRKLTLPERAAAASYHPEFVLLDTRKLSMREGLSEPALQEIEHCLAQGHQALVYINRRGYAPVLHCNACGWNSQCPRCSVHAVLHKTSSGHYRLQCHHCGFHAAVPRACPDCGNQDLRPLGQGTQRLESFLRERFPDARIQRIDADSTRRKGQAQALLEQVHQGEVDILVGTQMVSKGHDFRRLQLVCIVNADNSLYSADFRASERLFSQLLQVAGRAGRHLPGGRVLLQTREPQHMLYRALVRQDYPAFADCTLEERRIAGLPPFSHQALISAQAREITRVLEFLAEIRDFAQQALGHYGVVFYDPVPLRIQRVMNIERGQLLLECASRQRLQQLLKCWLPEVHRMSKKPPLKYFVEVDPLEI